MNNLRKALLYQSCAFPIGSVKSSVDTDVNDDELILCVAISTDGKTLLIKKIKKRFG